MPQSSSDEVELTRAVVRASGVRARPVPPPERPEAMFSRIMEQTERESRPATPHRVPRRPTAIAATAAAVALVVVLVPTSPRPAAATPPLLEFSVVASEDLASATGLPAGELLLDLAVAAERRADPAPGVVQVVERDSWYLDLRATATSGGAIFRPTLTTTWRHPDGSMTSEERRDPLRDASGEPAPEDWLAAHRASTWTIDLLGLAVTPPETASDLPTEPAELRAHLLSGTACLPGSEPGESAEWCRFLLLNRVADVSAHSVVPAAVDAAIWRLLADDPGFATLGETRERHGRSGVTVAARDDASGVLLVLVVDPGTGALLGEERILLADDPDLGIDGPAVVGFTSFLGSRWEPADAGPTIDPRMVCKTYADATACHLPVAETG